ncbi:glycosyl transferase family 2 [Litoreibacter ponti]|uniref:Glycosyl transferase family 2 n=1 Tax=Litoreibacter ponti TaxID=1510457 RepID=A0A2T6BHV5_9RHOB|nr:glycosyltransferase family 2 protein [Litoreibacter ponti]PTX55645.1 glycosyl transferase family 2 [Litoreibacter ponti]
MSAETHLIAAAMRNEGPYLVEWIAHHLGLGFDHALVFTHGSQDGTDKMLRRLEKLGVATHRRNPPPERRTGGHRPRAARRALRDPVYLAHDWAMFIDPNEFVNLDASHISALTARGLPLTLPRRIFGSAGVSSFHDGFQTETFRRAAAELSPLGPRSLHRTAVQTPAEPPSAQFGQINCYATRTREAFLLEAHLTGKAPARFHTLNRAEVYDASILPKLDAMKDIYDELMSDHKLARLHNRAVEWHRTQIDRLKQTEAGREIERALKPGLALFPGLRQRLSA